MGVALRQLGIEALQNAHAAFIGLARDGSARADVGLNQFGEMAMLIDLASEEVAIKHLRDFALARKQGIRVVSEEHGEFVIGEHPRMTAFAALLIIACGGSPASERSAEIRPPGIV